MEIRYLQPDGLVRSPAFSHGAVIPPGATTIYIGGQNGVDETGQVVASHDAAAQAVRAVDNVETVLRAGGATLSDVVAWTVLIAADADVAAAYGAIAPRLARAGAPPLVTAARVAGLAVPGAPIFGTTDRTDGGMTASPVPCHLGKAPSSGDRGWIMMWDH